MLVLFELDSYTRFKHSIPILSNNTICSNYNYNYNHNYNYNYNYNYNCNYNYDYDYSNITDQFVDMYL